ncbi:hypothetical protein EV182_002399, partial [Spiromyces aspiralis]
CNSSNTFERLALYSDFASSSEPGRFLGHSARSSSSASRIPISDLMASPKIIGEGGKPGTNGSKHCNYLWTQDLLSSPTTAAATPRSVRGLKDAWRRHSWGHSNDNKDHSVLADDMVAIPSEDYITTQDNHLSSDCLDSAKTFVKMACSKDSEPWSASRNQLLASMSPGSSSMFAAMSMSAANQCHDPASGDYNSNQWFQLHLRNSLSAIPSADSEVCPFNDSTDPHSMWMAAQCPSRWVTLRIPFPPRTSPQIPWMRWYIWHTARIPYIGRLLFWRPAIVAGLAATYLVSSIASVHLQQNIMVANGLDWVMVVPLLQHCVVWVLLELFTHRFGINSREGSQAPPRRVLLLPLAGLFSLTQLLHLTSYVVVPNGSGSIYLARPLAILLLFYLTIQFAPQSASNKRWRALLLLPSSSFSLLFNSRSDASDSHAPVKRSALVIALLALLQTFLGSMLALWSSTKAVNPSPLPWGIATWKTSVGNALYGLASMAAMVAYLYVMQLTMHKQRCSGLNTMRRFLPYCILSLLALLLTFNKPTEVWARLSKPNISALIKPTFLGSLALLASYRLVDDIGALGFIFIYQARTLIGLAINAKRYQYPFSTHNTIGVVLFTLGVVMLAARYLLSSARLKTIGGSTLTALSNSF